MSEELTERIVFTGKRTAGVVSTALRCRGMLSNGVAIVSHPAQMDRQALQELAQVVADLLATPETQ